MVGNFKSNDFSKMTLYNLPPSERKLLQQVEKVSASVLNGFHAFSPIPGMTPLHEQLSEISFMIFCVMYGDIAIVYYRRK
jgi:hypothetical protein